MTSATVDLAQRGTCQEPADSGTVTFETALGPCGLAWGPGGVRALVLGESEAAPFGEPPAWVRAACDRLARHLTGDLDALEDVPVDLGEAAPFHREVLTAARAIAPGETVTYGELARRLGRPGAARAVGGAMARNPIPLLIPCHRVLRSDGGLGGYSAPGGRGTKERLLALEGASAGS